MSGARYKSAKKGGAFFEFIYSYPQKNGHVTFTVTISWTHIIDVDVYNIRCAPNGPERFVFLVGFGEAIHLVWNSALRLEP